MDSGEKERLIMTLQDHVNNITNLRIGNYFLAESLTQRTKRLASKYFKDQDVFKSEIDEINFKPSEKQDHYSIAVWNDSFKRLLTISQAMLDEVQLPSDYVYEINHPITKTFKSMEAKRKLYAAIFFITASLTLWSFNYTLNWGWLAYHHNKIAIYLCFQIAIVFIAFLFLTNKKHTRFIEWLSIAISIALAIISFLN